MDQKPFYQTSSKLKHHFLNIKRTQTCSSIGDQTQTPYFWLRTNELRTLNVILTRTSIFSTSNELKHVHLVVIELEHPIFGLERLYIKL